MASTYSSNLKIELMSTGENSGTWGDITNANLGTTLEQAVIGLGNPDYTSDANLTITLTNSNAAQAARALVLNVTSAFGSLTATRELIVPTIQKQYIVQNNTTGGQSITVKTSAGTGITVPNGRKAHLYVNGTNVIQMFDFVNILGGTIDNATLGATTASSARVTTLNASGATTLDGNVALGNAAGDLITVPGTINSNLLFTDNSFDIGASGATRPRNLFLSGNATMAGNLSVGGTLTLTGGVNLNGNVTVGDTAADTLTINATITSNLLFTDNTYDIGASGATRPRNLFLAGNATIGGAQTLTGALTVDSTTDSSSTTTGSIQTDGGVGIAKALFVGTTADIAGAVTLGGGTANGVAYLNGSKVLTTGSELTTNGSTYLTVPPEIYRNSATSYVRLTGGDSAGAGATVLAFGQSHASAPGRLSLSAIGTGDIISNTISGVHLWQINSAEQMRLNSTGLGIGTSSPTRRISAVNTSSGGPIIEITGSGGAGNELGFGVDGTGGYLQQLGSRPISFYLGGAERMRLDSSGNLCVGSSSAGNAGTLNVSVGNPGTTTGGLQLWSTTTGSHTIQWGDGTSGSDTYRGAIEYAHSGDTMRFYTSATEQMRLTSTGLGIGTSSPGAKLHVAGAEPQLKIGGTNPAYCWDISREGVVAGNLEFKEVNNGVSTLRMTLEASGNLGLGVTPSAWRSADKVMQAGTGIGQYGHFVSAGVGAAYGGGFYRDDSGFKYTTTNAPAGRFDYNYTASGGFTWNLSPTGTAGNAISFTQAMTLDASGNLLVGTTSAISKLTVQGASDIRITVNESSSSVRTDIISQTTQGQVGTVSNHPLDLITNGTGRARIDSSGNLGLGVIPSAWSGNTAFQVGRASISFNTTYGTTNIGANQYEGAAGRKYIASQYALQYEQQANTGTHAWFTAPSGTAGDAISFTQPMTLTAAGDLLVGTTSSVINTAHSFKATGTTSGYWAGAFQHEGTGANGRVQALILPNTSDGGSYFIYAVNSTGNAFNVYGNGNVQNTNNSYGAISDAKLKENVVDATPKLDKLNQVRVVNFNLIGHEQKQIGVIAQELEQVFPGMVEETPDRDQEGNDLGTTTKSVKYSVFVPMLIKAMQEQQAIIESLKARLDAANL